MYGQHQKLQRANKNVKHIEESSVPGIDKLVGLISKAKVRNAIVIAFVLALCMVFFLFMQGMTVSSSTINNY